MRGLPGSETAEFRALLESKNATMKFFLLDPDPPNGGGGAPNPPNPSPQPVNPPAPGPARPPAAGTALAGTKTERELQLEEDLRIKADENARLAQEKRDRETKIAELEDQLDRTRRESEPDHDEGDTWHAF